MTKKTKMILGGVAVLGVAYYLYKKSQDKEMASMSGYSNMDGVRMSRFANASGLSMSPFSGSTARRRVCTRMEKDGSSTTYTAFGGRCPYGGTVSN
jgi:hypothetical protein